MLGRAGFDSEFLRQGFHAEDSAAGFVREGFHAEDSAAGLVREGLIPGHLRKGDRVSRLIRALGAGWCAREVARNSSAKVSTA